jgi:hypothetical protein
LSRQFRVLHPQSLNPSVCTQKNEEPSPECRLVKPCRDRV